MNWIQEISDNRDLENQHNKFLDRYGTNGLKCALQKYDNNHQYYICKTRTSLYKIPVKDIYYLEIWEHNIAIYTYEAKYTKYGSLSKELATLAPFGFAQCNQSILVALDKIISVEKNIIILIGNCETR